MVTRPRLLDRLTAAAEGPLTVLSAPAGSGKTVLVAGWAASHPGSLTWVTPDEGDDPAAFWTVVAEGLLGHPVAEVSRTATGRTTRRFLLDLVDDVLRREEPTVLVLDAGDALDSREVGEDLDELIGLCEGRLRVVLLTRAVPYMRLHRRRLEGTVSELRAADLAFTLEETRRLVAAHGLHLDDADLELLRARTRGWAAGLRFAVMGLLAGPDPHESLRQFSGGSGNVASFLITEVLDAQPPHIREFLLRTCVATRLLPGLVETLTDDPHAQQVLAFVARGNAFVEPVEGAVDTYRYQPLFREFLRARLAYEHPELARTLHLRAAEWLAESGSLSAATGHAVDAEKWDFAAGYVVESFGVTTLLAPRSSSRDARMLALLPDDARSASAAVVRAAAAVRQLDGSRALREVAKARAGVGDEPARRARALRFSCDLLEALAAGQVSDVDLGLEAVGGAERELADVPLRALAAHPEIRPLVVLVKGKLLLEGGRPTAASRALADAVTLAGAPGCEELLVECLGFAALAAAVGGRLTQARELASRSDAAADAVGGPDGERSGRAALALAWVDSEVYDVPAARSHLERAAARVAGGRDQLTESALSLVRARLLRADGDLDAALGVLREADELLTAPRPETWPRPELATLRADILAVRGEPVGTPPAAPPVVAEPDDVTLPLGTRVARGLLDAAAALDDHDEVAAVDALDRALRLAAQEHMRRPFLEADERLRALLAPGRTLADRHAWLERGAPTVDEAEVEIGHQPVPGTLASPLGDLVITPLTNKEQEVLVLLADLLSTDEIAAQMFVSVNTVRSHVRSILRKLGAGRRNEAVRHAWELGLLPRRPSHPTSVSGGAAG